jgi:hypothetical protein
MMTKITRLRETGATDPRAQCDPLRVQLADALTAAERARDAVARQKQAVQRLSAEMRETEETTEKLQKAVSKAQEAHVEAIANAAASWGRCACERCAEG